MNNTMAKVSKAIAGVLVLVVLVVTVNRWWGEYRTAGAPDTPASTTTTTAPPQGEGEGDGDAQPDGAQNPEATTQSKTVVVLTEGLNFRKEPSRDGEVIRGLDKGEKLVLIETTNGWHRVEDEDETRGWISANSTYSEVR